MARRSSGCLPTGWTRIVFYCEESARRRRILRIRVLLFAIRDGRAVKTSDLAGGEAGQGIVFTADNKYILIQFNVEKQLAVYAVNDGDMKDTQLRIVLSGGPASLRSMPR